MVFFHKVYASLKGSMYKIYLNISSRDKFLPLLTAKIIFDDLRNFSLSGRGASEKPSVEQNNDCFLKWLGRGIDEGGEMVEFN